MKCMSVCMYMYLDFYKKMVTALNVRGIEVYYVCGCMYALQACINIETDRQMDRFDF